MLPHVRRPMSSNPRSDALHLLFLQRQGDEGDKSPPATSSSAKFQTVVVATAEGELGCPHCCEMFKDEVSLRSHVFRCRMDHEIDPLLPLNILYRRHRMQEVAHIPVSQRRTQSARGKVDRYSSANTTMEPRLPHDDLTRIMRPIERSADIEHKQLISPRLSSRVVPTPPILPTSQASHRRQAGVYGGSNKKMTNADSLELWQKPLRILLANTSVRSGNVFAVSDKLVSSLLALATQPLEDDCVLDLSSLAVIHQCDVALLVRVLSPSRRAEALPITTLNISGCTFEHMSSEEALLESLRCHPTLQNLLSNSTTWKLRVRYQSTTTFPSLGAVLQRCALNSMRARLEASERELELQASAFKSWQRQHLQERQHVDVCALEERTALAKDEIADRKVIQEFAARTTHNQVQLEKKRRIKEKKEVQRGEVVVAEERARGRMAAAFLSLLLNIYEQLESAARRELIEERELCRLRLRVEDREDVFRAKIHEIQRVEREAAQRLEVESHLEVRLVQVMAESAEELEQIGKQKARHKAYTQWRRRQKEELDHMIRQERLARDTIRGEEDGYFVSGREKLSRTIESIQIRYANQREYVETSENNVRSIVEKSMISWMQLSLHFFESETRLILSWQNSVAKENSRVECLTTLPTLELVEGAPQPLTLFGAATPGHDAPHPIPVFPSSVKLQLSMGPEWQQRFHDITQRCKRASQDEMSAFSEHMQGLNRFCRLFRDSYAIAFETPLEELRNSYMQPLTRMQQIMSGASSTTAPRASVSPPFGSWTPPNEDLSVSIRRDKSKRKLSVAPLPIEPVSDPVFLELSQKALRWRGAWHDRFSPHHVKNEKESIRHAFVEFTIEDSVTSPASPTKAQRSEDDLSSTHRLQTKTSRSYYADEVLIVPAEQSASQVDVDQSSPTTSPHANTSLNDFDTATGRSESVTSASPIMPSGARNTLRVDIRLPSEDADLDSSLSSDPRTPSSNSKARGKEAHCLSTDDISAELQKVLYQCIVSGADMQRRGGCGLVKISFTIAATVTVSNVYCDALLAPDVFGYAPRMPVVETRNIVIETRGSCFIGVVPSCFVIVSPEQPLPIELPPRILVEKQMDEVIIFPSIYKINGPLQVHRSKMSSMLATAEDANQGFAGGALTIEVVDGSSSDRLSLRDDLPSLKFECHEKTRAVRTITLNGSTIGEVVDGSIQSTKYVLSTNNLHVAPRVVISLRDLASAASRISPESVKTILTRLRYHNYDVDPQEGPRIVRVTLRGSNGAQSVLDTHFEIEGIDKPTELRIVHQKVTHRAPFLSCPPVLRSSLINTFLPVFPMCVVFDEDTDRFSGGGLRLTLQGGVKGDTLVFVPDTRVLSLVDEMIDTLPVLRIVDQNQVVFQDRVVATLIEGNVALDQEFLDASTASETPSLRFEFASDDECSISAVQAILSVTRKCRLNPGLNLPFNATLQREVLCELQIQDNEQPTHITETVTVRAAGHSIQLPDKAAVIDFKEGSPPIKIGNIDVSNDRVKPITTFSGSQILVYIGDGYTEGDVIGLKQDDTEYKILEQKRSA
ncbi:Hypothetical protein, putative, partial [Bodo saltans]